MNIIYYFINVANADEEKKVNMEDIMAVLLELKENFKRFYNKYDDLFRRLCRNNFIRDYLVKLYIRAWHWFHFLCNTSIRYVLIIAIFYLKTILWIAGKTISVYMYISA